MKRTSVRGLIASLALVAAASAPGMAAAQSTWNLGASTCGSGSGTIPSPVECIGSSTTETAKMWAFGNTGAGSSFVQADLGNWDPSGFGAKSGWNEKSANGHHAFDNKIANCGSGSSSSGCGGSTELMLISFGPYKVNLTDVAIGWYSGDADVSILRWDGANAPNATSLVTGKTTNGLITDGWTLVGSQDLVGTGAAIDNVNDGTGTALTDSGLSARKSTINLGDKVSSYWIISTYFGNNSGVTAGSLGSGNDAFKLLSFAANVCTSDNYIGGGTGSGGNGGTCGPSQTGNVPEPVSLALVAAGLLAATGTRRRRWLSR